MDASGKLLTSRLISLVQNGRWEKDDVVKLFEALVEQFKGRNDDFHIWMMRILYQVEIHRIKVSDLTSNDSKIVNNVETKVERIAKNTDEKTLQEILEEIRQQGNFDEELITQVKDVVSSVSGSLSYPTAPHLQGIKQTLFKLCKAVEQTMKYRPRLTQMVSWCILALSKSSRLVQVGTGEGKSCIVAMFAAHQAMLGKTPDIISSSPVLAERDAEEWAGFYKTLEITVNVNTNKTTDNELKKCYDCQVVYGTTQSFAADWLRQRFHRKKVRPKREFECVIVDEVDSLMLDKGLEVVYLNSNIPLMEQLNIILAEIWLIVNQIKLLDSGEILGPTQCFAKLISDITHENKNIDEINILQTALDAGIMPNKSKQMQENMTLVQKQLHNASVVQMVAFLTLFVASFPEYFFHLYQELPDGTLKKQNTISPAGTTKRLEISIVLLGSGKYRVVHSNEDSLIASIANRIKMGYETTKRQNESVIPGLEDLIKGKVHAWIENALGATKMTLGHEYILHEDGVAPVDYKCTGVVQNDMKWGDGLQQFLEMKHQTKLTNMDLITNFMSNVGLFKKYQNQIYGITGTLGDQTELDMLKELYNGIEICKIPSFRPRKLYELEGLVISEEDEWIRTVCNVVQEQVSSMVYRSPRAALVICETINRAQMIHKTLAEKIPKEKLKLYVNNNMNNSTIIDSKVQKSDIIIATNLAGRGTDLKVCKNVNEAGGLFVLQTFLPLNVRVEQQAFGRTARQGNPGSAQLIVCTSHFSNSIKMVMGVKSSTTTLFSHLESLTTALSRLLKSHVSTEDRFEEEVHLYLKDHSFQTHKAMVSAVRGLLTMKSMPNQESPLEMAKDARNIMVRIRLSGFLDKDIPEILKKEDIFSVYLDILDGIYKDKAFSDQRDAVVPSLHECWGLWLLMHFSEDKSFKTLKEQLEVALLGAKQKFLNRESPSSMVYYYVRSGNDLRKKGRLAESIEMYTKALEDGASGEIIPLYNRALATIMRKDTGYVRQALADLEKADKAIDLYKLHLAVIHTLVTLSQQGPETEGSVPLKKQFLMKCIVLYILKTNIQDSVAKLRRAESRGSDVRLTETAKNSPTEDNSNPPEVLKEILMEFIHVMELGLDDLFSLDVTFSFSGFLSKVFKWS